MQCDSFLVLLSSVHVSGLVASYMYVCVRAYVYNYVGFCACICVVYIYICIYIRTHREFLFLVQYKIFSCLLTSLNVCLYAFMRKYSHIAKWMRSYTRPFIECYVHACLCLCTHIHTLHSECAATRDHVTNVRVFLCMPASVYAHIHNFCTVIGQLHATMYMHTIVCLPSFMHHIFIHFAQWVASYTWLCDEGSSRWPWN